MRYVMHHNNGTVEESAALPAKAEPQTLAHCPEKNTYFIMYRARWRPIGQQDFERKISWNRKHIRREQSAKNKILAHLVEPDYPYSIARELGLSRITVKIVLLELQKAGQITTVESPPHAAKGPCRTYYQAR